MRSRYSAFALGLADYLRHSWHPDTLPPDFGADDVRWEDDFKWIGLAIESVEAGGPFDAEGTVTFTAVARGPEGRFAQRERSRFVRVAGGGAFGAAGAAGAVSTAAGARWVYVDGVQLDA